MLKKGTKYIPSRIPEKSSNNSNNNNNNNTNKKDILSVKPDLSHFKYRPCVIYGSKDKENKNDFSKVLNKKTEEAENGFDRYIQYYLASGSAISSEDEYKSFIVEYMFSYDEYNEVTGQTYRKFMGEQDVWSANTIGEAILLTYKNFGKLYLFNQKYKDKKNIQFEYIYDAYVKIDLDTFIPKEYSEKYSSFNEAFRKYWSDNIKKI